MNANNQLFMHIKHLTQQVMFLVDRSICNPQMFAGIFLHSRQLVFIRGSLLPNPG